MTNTDRLGFAVMIAMACATLMLRDVTGDTQVFWLAALMIVVNGHLGIIARRLGLAERWVQLLQVGVGLALCGYLVTTVHSDGRPGGVGQVLDEAVRWIRSSTAPMAPNPSVSVVLACAIWMLAVTADMLVVSLNRPVAILAPLTVLYAIPALVLDTSASVTGFVLFALAFGVVLLADAANRVSAGRPGERPTLRRRWSGVGVATVSLVAAVVGSLVIGAMLRFPDAGTFGPLQGRGPIQMSDPSLDLKRNLEQPADQRVISYTTDASSGKYLRMAALTRMDSAGWHLEPVELFDGPLPRPRGVQLDGPLRRTRIEIDDFQSQWLPLPYAPLSFDAIGEWRHDRASSVVLWAGPSASGTSGLHFDVVSQDVDPSRQQIEAAEGGDPNDASSTLQVPDDLPVEVAEWAQRVTEQAKTDGQRALALQEWFRSDEFSYSIEPAGGSGYAALTRFLTDDRRGYCEQFAASMAIMARALGIPARVMIGFLPGKNVGDRYEVSIRDMHAWPELYFEGLGWISFEPTPGVSGSAPPFSANQPSASPSPTPTPTPTEASPTPSAEPEPSEAPADAPAAADPGSISAATPWVAGFAALVALGLAPWALRQFRRRRRAKAAGAAERAEAAWDEVRDVVWDTGGQWPSGSPRAISEALAGRVGEGGRAALDEITGWVEQTRYDRAPGPVPLLNSKVDVIREALWAQPDVRSRAVKKVFPRSVWQRLWWHGSNR